MTAVLLHVRSGVYFMYRYPIGPCHMLRQLYVLCVPGSSMDSCIACGTERACKTVANVQRTLEKIWEPYLRQPSSFGDAFPPPHLISYRRLHSLALSV